MGFGLEVAKQRPEVTFEGALSLPGFWLGKEAMVELAQLTCVAHQAPSAVCSDCSKVHILNLLFTPAYPKYERRWLEMAVLPP